MDYSTLPRPTTLADLTLSWRWADYTYTITGEEIAYLVLAAIAGHKPGFLPQIKGDVGIWVSRLQGLGAMICRDAGIPMHDEEARAMMDDILKWAAGHIAAADYNLEAFAQQCVVMTAPGAGLQDVDRVLHDPRGFGGGLS